MIAHTNKVKLNILFNHVNTMHIKTGDTLAIVIGEQHIYDAKVTDTTFTQWNTATVALEVNLNNAGKDGALISFEFV